MSNSIINHRYSRLPRRSRSQSSEDEDSENASDAPACMDRVPLMMMCGTEAFDVMDENDRLVRERRRGWRGFGGGADSAGGAWRLLKRRWSTACSNCWQRTFYLCCGQRELRPRTVHIGLGCGANTETKYPRNVVRNQKYSIITFIPKVLFEQFKIFLNLYFLLIALTQFLPELRMGYLYTYWGPLAFVILVTMCREAVDDYRRYLRDKEANSQRYKRLTRDGVVQLPSSDIQVGHLIILEKDQRVPADMILLRTSDTDGGCFIRTDQLDGETDWKLRLAVQNTHRLPSHNDLMDITAHVYAEKPQQAIHSFIGTYTRSDEGQSVEDALSIENTMWANTVVASGTALGVVIYTGGETRAVMNTSQPNSKMGLLDMEINTLTKLLFAACFILALVMMILKGFGGPWYRYFLRFIVLFSYVIPISLRVNLDMGKAFYSWVIQRDKHIPGITVRSTTIPEELGRITYLLSDKTGTLTQNEMVFKRLHLGTVSFTSETMDEVQTHLRAAYSPITATPTRSGSGPVRRTVTTRVTEAVRAIALCHNVTPVFDDPTSTSSSSSSSPSRNEDTEADQQLKQSFTYQASSPDEIALVTWSGNVNLTLVKRSLDSITLRTPTGTQVTYTILQIFPFTSESKRMGIILRDDAGEITFYLKGADMVMQSIVQYNDWLEEECGNMAREGLRTLVVAKKVLTEDQYQEFESRYHQAKISIQERNSKMQAVVEGLERDMELLCLTGVEDKLQDGVRPTLEMLRNAGVRVWMLTGDKLETAICIAKSSKLVSRLQDIHVFQTVTDRSEAHLELNALRRKNEAALVITGDSLQVCLKFYEHEFVELACQCPAVVVCRCSPTQKAEIVNLLKVHTGKRTCAVGDGGNDVSMIQAADAGIGIVGKEGKQASLAADFSINQFSHIGRLMLVHGRNSYKRSAALGQFVIHRGLIITTMQAVFCSVFYFVSISLFPGFLMVGYATVFTMYPVFSLVLDKDVSADIALTYPELYKDLTKGRSLSFKTFFMWVLISIYQGGIIMYGALLLFEAEFIHVVSITFTSLILTELLMVALNIRNWHILMVVAQVFSFGIYVAALGVLRDYFDPQFLRTWDFIWKVLVITSISCIPLYVLKYLRKKFSPPVYSKLTP